PLDVAPDPSPAPSPAPGAATLCPFLDYDPDAMDDGSARRRDRQGHARLRALQPGNPGCQAGVGREDQILDARDVRPAGRLCFLCARVGADRGVDPGVHVALVAL